MGTCPQGTISYYLVKKLTSPTKTEFEEREQLKQTKMFSNSNERFKKPRETIA